MSISYKTIFSLAFFFGWLLSFPLYGPILDGLHPSAPNPESIGLTFTIMHAAGLAAGMFLKQRNWLFLMKIGVTVTFLTSIAFIFVNPNLMRPLSGVLGFFAALVIIGWSHLSSNALQSNRLRRMALIILTANLFLTGVSILVDRLPGPAVLWIVNIPLAIAAVVIFTINPPLLPKEWSENPIAPRKSFPQKLLFYLCLAIFGLYLSGGFLYNGILPFYQNISLWNCFPELIYILTLLVIWKFGPPKNLIHLAYYSISLLGLGLIAFMSGKDHAAGYFLCTTLIFSALAFLDVFLWTILGTIAAVCRQPFKVFGLGLTVNLLALYTGGMMTHQFSARFGHYLFLMSMVALAAMDLVILIIPLLTKVYLDTIKKKLSAPATATPGTRSGLKAVLPEMNLLTPKESEIIQYIIEGASNKEIAAQLHISENTLKVHIKNITRKFGVSGKYELLSFILNALSPNAVSGKDVS
jgi:DNA-binding CsgD family transcriptional regulator